MIGVPEGSGLLVLRPVGAVAPTEAEISWASGSLHVTQFPARIVLPLYKETKVEATRVGYERYVRSIVLLERIPRQQVDLEMQLARPLGLCGLHEEDVARESGLEPAPSGHHPQGRPLFEISSRSDWGGASYKTIIDDQGDVWLEVALAQPIGHISSTQLAHLTGLRAAALAGEFSEKIGIRCYDCGGTAYYACDPSPVDWEPCVLGYDGAGGAQHRTSAAAKELLGWLFAVERDVNKLRKAELATPKQ